MSNIPQVDTAKFGINIDRDKPKVGEIYHPRLHQIFNIVNKQDTSVKVGQIWEMHAKSGSLLMRVEKVNPDYSVNGLVIFLDSRFSSKGVGRKFVLSIDEFTMKSRDRGMRLYGTVDNVSYNYTPSPKKRKK